MKNSPKFIIEHDWRANRHHSTDDDLAQSGALANEPMIPDDYVPAIARMVANDPIESARPATTVFKLGRPSVRPTPLPARRA